MIPTTSNLWDYALVCFRLSFYDLVHFYALIHMVLFEDEPRRFDK